MIARPIPEPAGVFQLVGDRPYVQASQMIARAADRIVAQGDGTPTLVASAFRRLTAETLDLVDIDAGRPTTGNAIGSASFSTANGTREIAFVPSGRRAERITESATWSLAPLDSDASAVRRDFANTLTFEDVVDVVIRSVKQYHATLAADVRDIWFTGCRDADLRVPTAPHGDIRLTPLRTLTGKERHQTMTAVDLRFDDGSTQTAIVSFAFHSAAFVA